MSFNFYEDLEQRLQNIELDMRRPHQDTKGLETHERRLEAIEDYLTGLPTTNSLSSLSMSELQVRLDAFDVQKGCLDALEARLNHFETLQHQLGNGANSIRN